MIVIMARRCAGNTLQSASDWEGTATFYIVTPHKDIGRKEDSAELITHMVR